MRGANSNTPAAGRPGRSQRPGFSHQIRLVGGDAGRRVEREQAEAIAEVLRWFAANPGSVSPGAAPAVPRAGRGLVGAVPAEVASGSGEVGWPYSLEVRARAVELVGVGRTVREVAGLVGVHPGTVRGWVRQAVGRWAVPVDASNWLLRRDDQVGCVVFSPIDRLEHNLRR
jgi:hypothetical protein